MQVTIGYKKPKSVVLTPSRKKIAKILARGSKASIIKECLNDEKMRKIVFSQVGRIVRKEIRILCSDKFGSVMKKGSVRKYSFKAIIKEMEGVAPSLLAILHTCTRYTPRKRECLRKSNASRLSLLTKRQNATIAMCTSILCNYRCPAMTLLQKVISLVLYSGSCSKMVNFNLYVIILPLAIMLHNHKRYSSGCRSFTFVHHIRPL